MCLRPVGGDERPKRPGDAAGPVRGAGGGGFGKRLHVERIEPVVDAELDKSIMVDCVSVRRRHRRAGVEIFLMHLSDEAGMIDHHLRRPERCRRVTGTGHQFLPHAAVEKNDIRHVSLPYQAGGKTRENHARRAAPRGTWTSHAPLVGGMLRSLPPEKPEAGPPAKSE